MRAVRLPGPQATVPEIRERMAARGGRALMWEQIARLHAHHSDVAPEVRVLKLAKETGEVA